MHQFRMVTPFLLFLALVMNTGALAQEAGRASTLSVDAGEEAGRPVLRSATRQQVQGESFSTSDNETLEILFSDGSSLTLAANAAIVIERFEYDPATRLGQLSVRVERGLIRVNGGVLNNTAEIQVTTPTGEIAIDNAIAFVDVDASGATNVIMAVGRSIHISAAGNDIEIVKAGFGANIDAASRLSGASAVGGAQIEALSVALNPGLASGVVPEFRQDEQAEEEPEDTLASTALAMSNAEFLTQDERDPGNVTFPSRPDPVVDALDPDSFDPGFVGTLGGSEDPTSKAAQMRRAIAQNRDNRLGPSEDDAEDTERSPGFSTNRLFSSAQPGVVDPFATIVQIGAIDAVSDEYSPPDQPPDLPATPLSNDLQYLFVGAPGANDSFTAADFLAIDRVGDESKIRFVDDSGFSDIPNQLLAPIVFPTIVEINGASVDLLGNGADLRSFTVQAVKPDFDDPENGIQSQGSIFDCDGGSDGGGCGTNATTYRFLQVGFSRASGFDPERSNDRVLRAQDNFLIFEARPDCSGGTAQSCMVEGGGGEMIDITGNIYVFATGNVSGNQAVIRAVDRFFITPGLNGFEERLTQPELGSAEGIRAFLRADTAPNLFDTAFVDTGLWIVNPPSTSTESSRLLHIDFGLAGVGSNQRSTISVTAAALTYAADSDNASVSSGWTIGSTQDNTGSSRCTSSCASIQLTSPLISTAVGGGNPVLPGTGRAGYLLLENWTADGEDENDNGNGPAGGLELPVGAPEDANNYAILRLATAVETQTADNPDAFQGAYRGWIAGLVEFEDSTSVGVAVLDSGPAAPGDLGEDPDFSISVDATNNTVDASVRTLRGRNAEEYPQIELGGTNGNSAFVDGDNYGAISADGSLGIVSGTTVLDGWNVGDAGMEVGLKSQMANYEYLEWGFFFGDTVTTDGSREHAHLASWVAGNVTPDTAELPSTMEASYSGHVLANIFNADNTYTAVGTFTNSWNFNDRSGEANIRLDNASYSSVTEFAPGSNARFSGVLRGEDDNSDRSGGMVGSFVQNGSDTHAGVIGQFTISGDDYAASGTYGAEKDSGSP